MTKGNVKEKFSVFLHLNTLNIWDNEKINSDKKIIPTKNATYFNQYIFYNLIAIIMDADITGKGLSQKYIPVK